MNLRGGWPIRFGRQKRAEGALLLVQNEAVRHRLEFRRQLQRKDWQQNTNRWRGLRLSPRNWGRWLVLPALVGVLYLVFGSKFFWLDTLQVSGTHLATQAEVTNALFPHGFKGVNAVVWPEGMARKRLLSKVPQISAVSFSKNLISNTLTVLVTEHQTSIVWETGGQQYLINRYGVVYEQASANTPLIVVEDLKNVPVSLNQKIVTPDFIDFITSFVANLPRKTDISITRVTIPETTFEVEMYTNQNWKIILDTTRPPDDQLNALVRVLQEMQGSPPREYIDLRIPNKVFYK